MGDVIGTGMGELKTLLIDVLHVSKICLTKSVSCSLAGVSVLVWDRHDSLISDLKLQEVTLTSADSLRAQRRSRQRSSNARRGPAVDPKLKKKLASLEESETKTKTKTSCTKQKQAQLRKKWTVEYWGSWKLMYIFLCVVLFVVSNFRNHLTV